MIQLSLYGASSGEGKWKQRLEMRLRRLDLSDIVHRAEGTRLISNELVKFANQDGYICQSEFPIYFGHANRKRRGFIDYVLTRGKEGLAFEVDSTNKGRSLEKLLSAWQLGYTAVWIRWCVKVSIDIPPKIYLIDLTDAPSISTSIWS